MTLSAKTTSFALPTPFLRPTSPPPPHPPPGTPPSEPCCVAFSSPTRRLLAGPGYTAFAKFPFGTCFAHIEIPFNRNFEWAAFAVPCPSSLQPLYRCGRPSRAQPTPPSVESRPCIYKKQKKRERERERERERGGGKNGWKVDWEFIQRESGKWRVCLRGTHSARHRVSVVFDEQSKDIRLFRTGFCEGQAIQEKYVWFI